MQRNIYLSLFFLLFGLSHAVPAADDVRGLLETCLPAQATGSSESQVNVEVTYKNAAPQTYHYQRYETPTRLLVSSGHAGDKALLIDKQSNRSWLFQSGETDLTAVDQHSEPLWLISESLLLPGELAGFDLSLGNSSSFGGQEFFSITATRMDNNYPKRILSFKREAEQGCKLIRAAYFNADDKLSKKIYVQWQTLGTTITFKSLHIEDVSTLEAVRYHIEDLKQREKIDVSLFPSIPEI